MKNIIKLLFIGLFIISCENNNKWSAENKRTFLYSCVEEASTYAEESSAYSYCDCCLVEIQKTYDEESFSKEEVKMMMGVATSDKFNNDMANIVIKCSDHLRTK